MEVYDIPKLKRVLGVSTNSARAYLRRRLIKGRKVGKRWLVSEDALRQFLMSSEQGRNQSRQDCEQTLSEL